MSHEFDSQNGTEIASIRVVFLSVGGIFLTIGFIMLVYLTYTAFQVFENPQNVPLIQYLLNLYPADGNNFTFTYKNGSEFESFELSQPLGGMLFIIFLFIGFSVFLGIAKAFLVFGIKMLMPSVFPAYAKQQLEQPFLKHKKNTDYADR